MCSTASWLMPGPSGARETNFSGRRGCRPPRPERPAPAHHPTTSLAGLQLEGPQPPARAPRRLTGPRRPTW
eukprot:966436-Pyramimonas_sp.AAC.1